MKKLPCLMFVKAWQGRVSPMVRLFPSNHVAISATLSALHFIDEELFLLMPIDHFSFHRILSCAGSNVVEVLAAVAIIYYVLVNTVNSLLTLIIVNVCRHEEILTAIMLTNFSTTETSLFAAAIVLPPLSSGKIGSLALLDFNQP